MKSASLTEIKQELSGQGKDELVKLCLQLAKYKADNKELLTYLLYEAADEQSFVRTVKEEMSAMFEEVNTNAVFYAKKTLRKIARHANRHIQYSRNPETSIELLLHFCEGFKDTGLDIERHSVLKNLYAAQRKKAEKAIASLHEDLQHDYQQLMDAKRL